MRLILLGAPGSGKGTQAKNIAEKVGITHVASGDLFRAAASRGDDLGNQAKYYMEKGLLVPDEITIKMILERIEKPDCVKGVMLDGFPRTLEQAKALDKALSEKGQSIDRVFYINVSTDELVRRLGGRFICRDCQAPYHQVSSPPKVEGKCDKCGGELYQRTDDNPETVRKRIDVYISETSPLIGYYKQADKLVEINGEGDIDDITKDIVAGIS
ncbi:MAG: adenylate kinase [Chloroflexota bacterium]|nr:adenylate kinase [Chloroflexota bacterium]